MLTNKEVSLAETKTGSLIRILF